MRSITAADQGSNELRCTVREQLRHTAEIAAAIASSDDVPCLAEKAATSIQCYSPKNLNDEKVAETLMTVILSMRGASPQVGDDHKTMQKLLRILQVFPNAPRLILTSISRQKRSSSKKKISKHREGRDNCVDVKMISHCPTPLHLLASVCDDIDALGKIFLCAPEIAALGNFAGETPLHLAVKNGHLNIVRYLCSRAPFLCRLLDDAGNLPLHVAVGECSQTNCESPLITSTILAHYPWGIVVPDGQGYLPVHLASKHGFVAGLRGILAINPAAVFDRAQLQGRLLPVDFALIGHRHASLWKSKSERPAASAAISVPHESNDGTQSTSLRSFPSFNQDGAISSMRDMDVDSASDISSCSSSSKRPSRCEQESFGQKLRYQECIEMLLLSAHYRRTVFCPQQEGQDHSNDDTIFLPFHALFVHRLQPQNRNHLIRMYRIFHAADTDHKSRTILHACADACNPGTACYSDDELIDILKQFHALDRTCSSARDFRGLTPLQLAVSSGASERVIKAFTEYGTM